MNVYAALLRWNRLNCSNYRNRTTGIADINDVLSDSENQVVSTEVSNIQAECMAHGYMLSAECVKCMTGMSSDELNDIADHVSDYFREKFGDGVYHTLFGNFPQTAISMNAYEFLWHTLLEYITAGSGHTYSPNPDDTLNDAEYLLLESNIVKDHYIMIEPGDVDDLAGFVTDLLKANQSMPASDKEIVTWFIEKMPDKLDLKIEDVPFKENQCILMEKLNPSTATDVLRYAMYKSGGDVTLMPVPKTVDKGWRKAAPTEEELAPFRFRNMKRPVRRRIMDMLAYVIDKAGMPQVLEDMKRYLTRWVRLGEFVHPGEFKDEKYKAVQAAFDIIRNNPEAIETWNSKVEKLLKQGKVLDAVDLLKKRPGEFARRIDQLLRVSLQSGKTPASQDLCKTRIIEAFTEVAPLVSGKVLYEVIEHFWARKNERPRRIFAKGSRKAVKLDDSRYCSLDKVTCGLVIDAAMKGLIARVAENGEDMTGHKVYLSEAFKKIRMPKAMRTASEGTVQPARGTRIPWNVTPDADLIRGYLRWYDEHGSMDFDLSAHLIDEKFTEVGLMSWNSCHAASDSEGKYAQFSGDCRMQIGACAEYIDICVSKALEKGIRYVILTAHDYNSTGFEEGDCYAGIMVRSQWGTPGEKTWAPESVEDGIRIKTDSRNVILNVIDLKARECILIDEDESGIPVASVGKDRIAQFCKDFIDPEFVLVDAGVAATIKYSGLGAEVEYVREENALELAKAQEEKSKALSERIEVKKKIVGDIKEKLKAGDSMTEDYQKEFDELTALSIEKDELNMIHVIPAEEYFRDYSKLLEFLIQ